MRSDSEFILFKVCSMCQMEGWLASFNWILRVESRRVRQRNYDSHSIWIFYEIGSINEWMCCGLFCVFRVPSSSVCRFNIWLEFLCPIARIRKSSSASLPDFSPHSSSSLHFALGQREKEKNREQVEWKLWRRVFPILRWLSAFLLSSCDSGFSLSSVYSYRVSMLNSGHTEHKKRKERENEFRAFQV